MKTRSLLGLGKAVTVCRDNPFLEAAPAPHPYLSVVHSPDLRPPLNEFEASTEDKSGRAENFAVKWVKRVFQAVVVLCVIGAQHVAYTRKITRLSAQLRQTELQVQAYAQANRQTRYVAAIQPAPPPWPAATHLARTTPPARHRPVSKTTLAHHSQTVKQTKAKNA